jgi:hypothetical protein
MSGGAPQGLPRSIAKMDRVKRENADNSAIIARSQVQVSPPVLSSFYGQDDIGQQATREDRRVDNTFPFRG